MTVSIRRAVLALSAFLVAALFLIASPREPRAEFRQPPNSRIALDLGAAFTPSERFSGFVDKGSGASFVIIEMPAAAYDELKTMPNHKEALAAQGLSDTAKAELPGRQGDFVYLVGKQDSPVGPFAKFVLIFLENDVTGMIISNIPQAAIDAGSYSREGIEKILATATVRDTPAAAAELFRFNHIGPFKEAFSVAGTSKAYNISGTRPGPGENRLVQEPMLIVSASIDTRAIDPKTAAKQTFGRLSAMKDGRINEEADVTIGGLKGYRVAGEAADATSGDKLAVQLVLLAGSNGGYFLIVGTTPIADKDKMMPEIDKVIASFEALK